MTPMRALHTALCLTRHPLVKALARMVAQQERVAVRGYQRIRQPWAAAGMACLALHREFLTALHREFLTALFGRAAREGVE